MSRSTASNYVYYVMFLTVILLVYSVASTSIYWIEPTDLGLASRLPLTYWIGLLLLGFLWYLGRESRNFSIAALVLTVSYLYVAPTIIRVPPWISNSYYPFGEALLINSTGHLVDRSPVTLISYLDWPVFLYFASSLTLITGIPHDILLKFFPLLLVSMYGTLAVLILRTKLTLSYAILGAACFLGSFFIRQHYFGPQGISYIFFLLILLFSTWLFFDERANKRTVTALLLFLCILTTFTHPLTSLMSLVVVFALYLTYRIILRKTSVIIPGLVLLSAVVWLGYNMYFATGFFDLTVQRFYDILFAGRELGLYSEPSRIIGSSAMQLNFVSSWGIVLLGGAIAAIAIFRIARNILTKTRTAKMGFSVFSAIMLIMFGLFAFAGEYGAHEAYQRAFMFGLIPISYLSVSLLAKKPRILIVFLVGLLFLNIPAQYGGDTYRLATDTQIAGAAFLANHTPQDISLIGKFSIYIRYHDPLKNIEVLSIGISFPYTGPYNASAVEEAINEALKEADYAMLSGLQDNFYSFFLGLSPFEQAEFDEKCNRVYDNWRLQIFKPVNITSQP